MIVLIAFGVVAAVFFVISQMGKSRWQAERDEQLRLEAAEEGAKRADYEARFREMFDAVVKSGTKLTFEGIERYFAPKSDERVMWAGHVIDIDGRGNAEIGFMTVTDQRVQFNFDNPKRADWSKSWRTIVSWSVRSGNTLVVEMSSGKPKSIKLPDPLSAGAVFDARLVEAVMKLARDAAK